MGRRIELDRDWLQEKYTEEWLSTTEIAKQADVSSRTVRRRLNEYGIDRPDGWRKRPIPESELRQKYIEHGLSERQIADGEDYSRAHVRKSLEYHNIQTRSQKKAIWKRHGEHPNCFTHPRGHVIISSGADMAYVHQLIAIAYGANPHELFNGNGVVHHRNGVKWDNRPKNIEIHDSQSEHMREHYYDGDLQINNAPR